MMPFVVSVDIFLAHDFVTLQLRSEAVQEGLMQILKKASFQSIGHEILAGHGRLLPSTR